MSLHGGTSPLAALTTVFTPGAGCPTSTWLLTSSRAPSQYPPFPTAGPSSCDPPNWTENVVEGSYEFYSPAVCPSGFSVGPSCTSVQLRTSEGFPSVEPGETVAFCVPSGYSCTADTTDFRGGVWGMLRTAGIGIVGAQVTVAPAVQIRWRDVDLTLLATHPLSPGVVVTAGPQQTSAPASTTTRGGNGVIVVSMPAPPTPTTLISNRSSVPTSTPTPSSPQSSTSPLSTTQPVIDNARTSSPSVRSFSSTSAASASASETQDLRGVSPMESVTTTGLPLGPIIFACLLSFTALVVGLFVYCVRRTREKGPLLPVGVGVWVGRGGSRNGSGQGLDPPWWLFWAAKKNPDRWPGKAIEGGGGGSPNRASLYGAPALGTKENPAELAELGNGDESAEQQRWSWVSRMFSIRAWREDGDRGDRNTRGSTPSSRRTTRSSKWTEWDSGAVLAEHQRNLSAPTPVVPPMPRRSVPAILFTSPKSPTISTRPLSSRSAFSARTTKAETKMRSTSPLRLSEFAGGMPLKSPAGTEYSMAETERTDRLSPARISGFGGGAPRMSLEVPDRLSRISDGTFGGDFPGEDPRFSRISRAP